jgi:insertion element IS1 protein InsB
MGEEVKKIEEELRSKLKVQMDELWSFVENKGNKKWVWLTTDASTREIIGGHIGDRSRNSAIALWQSIPGMYRQCAKVYTDYWEAYVDVIPSKRHVAVGKESSLTSYIKIPLTKQRRKQLQPNQPIITRKL